MKPKKPEREADYTIYNNGASGEFWFEEMYHEAYVGTEFYGSFQLRFNENHIELFDVEFDEWREFRSDFQEIFDNAYKKWLIKKELKNKLKEDK